MKHIEDIQVREHLLTVGKGLVNLFRFLYKLQTIIINNKESKFISLLEMYNQKQNNKHYQSVF